MLFLVLQVTLVIEFFFSSDKMTSLADLISPAAYCVTLLMILYLMNYDRRKGLFASGLLFGFWLLVSLTIIPDLIDYSVKYEQEVNQSFACRRDLFESVSFIS